MRPPVSASNTGEEISGVRSAIPASRCAAWSTSAEVGSERVVIREGSPASPSGARGSIGDLGSRELHSPQQIVGGGCEREGNKPRQHDAGGGVAGKLSVMQPRMVVRHDDSVPSNSKLVRLREVRQYATLAECKSVYVAICYIRSQEGSHENNLLCAH